MKAFRKPIHLIVILTMLSVAFQLVRPEDANRDNRLDLEDTILNVRALVRSAETSGSLAASLENAVASLKILAGLKTVIQAADHPINTGAAPVLDSPCLISTYSLYLPSYAGFTIIDDSIIFKSLSIAPSSPPPRSSLLS